jgi:hypothetical protein
LSRPASKFFLHTTLILFLALTGSGLVRATVVEPLTLPDLVRRSPTIVHGVVRETHVAWEAGRARLYTYVTVEARELLKGGGGAPVVVFRQLGGRDGDQVIYVPGTPRFAPKQEVLLFLTGEDAGGYPQIMGIFQGAFQPASDASGARRVEAISSSAAGTLLPGPSKRPERTPRAATPLGAPFGDFLEEIRTLVREQSGGPSR